MGKNVAIFLICFAIAFGGGYLFFKNNQASEPAQNGEQTDQAAKDKAIGQQQGDASDNEGRILVQRGCISCHSVSALNIQGGATGPDLSQAYVNVEGKHGVPIEEFLKKPTSAVMAGVLGDKPLTEDELKAVLEALKTASEK
ncbi:cytochrome C [Schinkia azotoformans]|uniref:cytochrome C n=1 Tax=Schinkia azotoformans TaxID=1454 RepID=UPI002E1E64C4|nr:cytochrome C [Schinkia azotoformans]